MKIFHRRLDVSPEYLAEIVERLVEQKAKTMCKPDIPFRIVAERVPRNAKNVFGSGRSSVYIWLRPIGQWPGGENDSVRLGTVTIQPLNTQTSWVTVLVDGPKKAKEESSAARENNAEFDRRRSIWALVDRQSQLALFSMLVNRFGAIWSNGDGVEPAPKGTSKQNAQPNVRVPTKPAVLGRWKAIWRKARGPWHQGSTYHDICNILSRIRNLSCSEDTLADIIRAGEAGLLDD